jgi:hypothetical protein
MKCHESRIHSAEMMLSRSAKGCSHSDRITNDIIREDVFAVRDEIHSHGQKWAHHLDGMPREYLSKYARSEVFMVVKIQVKVF